MDGFKTCKTNQLSLTEKKEICDLFYHGFHVKKSIEHFEQEFSKTCKGYSYHCLYKKDDHIFASFCIVPYGYYVNGGKKFFGLSVDTIVSPEAKLGPFGVADMAAATEALAERDGCSVLYGFPNDNFYKYNIEILERNEIGILDFYLVPLAPGKIKRYLLFLNFLSFFTIAILYVCKLFSSSREVKYSIEKDDSEAFRRGRYDSRHHFVKFDMGMAVYTLYEESFGTVAYIVDINPISAKNLYSAFLAVAQEVKTQAGLIAYPSGRLPFGKIIRLPQRFLPRKLHLVASGMNGHELPEVCKKMSNWKINLSDFDVR